MRAVLFDLKSQRKENLVVSVVRCLSLRRRTLWRQASPLSNPRPAFVSTTILQISQLAARSQNRASARIHYLLQDPESFESPSDASHSGSGAEALTSTSPTSATSGVKDPLWTLFQKEKPFGSMADISCRAERSSDAVKIITRKNKIRQTMRVEEKSS